MHSSEHMTFSHILQIKPADILPYTAHILHDIPTPEAWFPDRELSETFYPSGTGSWQFLNILD